MSARRWDEAEVAAWIEKTLADAPSDLPPAVVAKLGRLLAPDERTGSGGPVTVAGPAFARAIAEHIDRPVPEAACGQYIAAVHRTGVVTVWYPEGGDPVRLDGDSASAKNTRGMLLALHAGAIA
jgi:hypothetical protein